MLTLMGKPNSVSVRRTLENSRMLSSDVSAGYDPLYASAFEKKNASYLGMVLYSINLLVLVVNLVPMMRMLNIWALFVVSWNLIM